MVFECLCERVTKIRPIRLIHYLEQDGLKEIDHMPTRGVDQDI